MLYAQSYNLTWVLVDFLVGYVLVSGGVVEGKRERARSFPVLKHAALSLFPGCFLRWAWLHALSPSSLTVGTHVGSGRLGHGSPWLNAAASVRCLFFRPSQCCARDVGPVDTGEGVCAWECVLRERGERVGESQLRECIPLYYCMRLTLIFHTVLNDGTTGSHSQCCSLGVLWNAGTCSLVIPTSQCSRAFTLGIPVSSHTRRHACQISCAPAIALDQGIGLITVDGPLALHTAPK